MSAAERDILVDPDIQGGTPCFAGTRVPVKSLFDALDRGRSVDYFLEQFPSVRREQVRAVLREAERLLVSPPRPPDAADRRRMKVLLDENLPHALRGLLLGHDAYTVAYLGWSGTKNGALLLRAAGDGFDVFLTLDNGVRYQQNQQTLPLAIVVVRAPSNDMEDLRPLVPDILAGLAAIAPHTVIVVPAAP